MIKLGIDFDNTLIIYDALFKKAALEKNLIPLNFPECKNSIRDYLKERAQEKLFTTLQGEIYGSRIFEASQAKGMYETLKKANNNDIELFIISHKTKTPYQGPKYNLHDASYIFTILLNELMGIRKSLLKDSSSLVIFIISTLLYISIFKL